MDFIEDEPSKNIIENQRKGAGRWKLYKSVAFEALLYFEGEFSNILLVSGLEFTAVSKVGITSTFHGLSESLCLLCVLLVWVLVGLLFHS